MKVVYSVFVAIFIYIHPGSSSVEAKSHVSKHLTFFESKENVIKETIYFSDTQFNHSDTSKKTPDKQKKRNKKGVKPLLIGITSGIKSHPGNTSDGGIVFKQISYYFFAFSGNGKRGPPALLLL